jgi:hypothetical protein
MRIPIQILRFNIGKKRIVAWKAQIPRSKAVLWRSAGAGKAIRIGIPNAQIVNLEAMQDCLS